MKAKLTIFAAFLLFGGILAAQSSVEIKDLLVSPVMEIDTVTNMPVESDYLKLSVMCKISDISSAETVQILFETVENTGDIVTISANVVSVGDVYFLAYNSEQTEVTDSIFTVNVSLSETQQEAYNFITVFVTDNLGDETEHLVFTK
ncbi:MAG: hypothetical protein PHW82_09695 [Bacteroidales bacterium]|nr:hypothetical protein [Bacteroidales bacterium]